jgi:hypothetical protein
MHMLNNDTYIIVRASELYIGQSPKEIGSVIEDLTKRIEELEKRNEELVDDMNYLHYLPPGEGGKYYSIGSQSFHALLEKARFDRFQILTEK